MILIGWCAMDSRVPASAKYPVAQTRERCSSNMTNGIGRFLYFVAIACGAAGCLAASQVESPLDEEERATYRYALVQGVEDPVCRQLGKLYNDTFRQPWNFRDVFGGRLPQTDGHYYPHMPERWTQDQLFLWDMRYSIYPTSPEFESIQWTQATKSGRNRSPVRIAEFDIDNDGTVEHVVQDSFYGSGDSRNATDGFGVYATTLASSRAAMQGIAFRMLERPRETFAGDIIRPFVLDGLTYLSEYEAAFGSESWPLFRHDPPEKMWVKRYLGGQPMGQAMNATTVCEFDMHRDESSK